MIRNEMKDEERDEMKLIWSACQVASKVNRKSRSCEKYSE